MLTPRLRVHEHPDFLYSGEYLYVPEDAEVPLLVDVLRFLLQQYAKGEVVTPSRNGDRTMWAFPAALLESVSTLRLSLNQNNDPWALCAFNYGAPIVDPARLIQVFGFPLTPDGVLVSARVSAFESEIASYATPPILDLQSIAKCVHRAMCLDIQDAPDELQRLGTETLARYQGRLWHTLNRHGLIFKLRRYFRQLGSWWPADHNQLELLAEEVITPMPNFRLVHDYVRQLSIGHPPASMRKVDKSRRT